MTKKLLLIIALSTLFIKRSFAQSEEGYWDQVRKTEKEILLPDHKKTCMRVEIPTGTTQIVYRVSFLDENGQLRSSLSSAIGSVPSAAAQGSSAILGLLNVIGGSNKGRYYIFTSKEDADYYYSSGIAKNACYENTNDIPGDKNVLYLNKSACLSESTKYLWFAFYNANLFDDEKVVLEVLPWIDKKASRGWSLEVKNSFINNCKTINGLDKLSNKDKYCQCLLEKFQNSYKVQDFQQMTSTEMNMVSDRLGKECLNETGELKNIYRQQRNEVASLARQGRYSEAITKLSDVINNDNPNSIDYNNLGFFYLFTKQYLKAIKILKQGEQLDDTELLIKGNLAHAYLLNGDIEQAKNIYIKYRNQNVTESMSWVEMVKSDFSDFTKAGLPTDNFEMILNAIK